VHAQVSSYPVAFAVDWSEIGDLRAADDLNEEADRLIDVRDADSCVIDP
jgi:hypothetical protein